MPDELFVSTLALAVLVLTGLAFRLGYSWGYEAGEHKGYEQALFDWQQTYFDKGDS